MKNIKRSGLLLSVLFFIVTVTFFGPLDLFIANSSELWFGMDHMLTMTAILSGVAFVVLTAIGLILPGKARDLYSALLFIITLCLYIQGNYANISYGELDGTAVDWGAYTGYAIGDTIGWIAVIAGLLVLYFVKRDWFRSLHKYGAMFIIAVQLLSLAILFLTTNISAEKSDYFLSTEGMYQVSEDENMIIFILDSYDDAYYQKVFEEDPDKYREMFRDFTYFDNAAVGAARTKAGLPAILTGYPYPGELTYSQYIENYFDKTGLYTELKKQNYDVGIYTESVFVPDGSGNLVDNQHSSGYEVNSYPGLTKTYFDFTLYKYMPHIFKQYFWLYTGDFDQYKTSSTAEPYKKNDAVFYENMALSTVSDRNIFRLFHLNGPHSPYTFDEKMQVDPEGTDVLQQAKGSLYLVNDYICQMKELGIYDNATILIMADHGETNSDFGTPNAAHGILFVKNRQTQADYSVNSAPVSYFDLHASLLSQLGKAAGDTFFDIPNENRDRSYYVYDTLNGQIAITEYSIHGNLDDDGAVVPTGNVYTPTVKESSYIYGTKLTFGLNPTAASYIVKGISATDASDNHSWSTGKETVFKFPLEDQPEANILVTLDFNMVYDKNGPQEIIALANGTECYRTTVIRGKTLQFIVDGSLIESDGLLELTFQLPNAVSPMDLFGIGFDSRTLAIAFTGLTLEETSETQKPLYPSLSLSQPVICTTENPDAEHYLLYGFGVTEEELTWTRNRYAGFVGQLEEAPSSDLTCMIDLASVYQQSQSIVVSVNGTEVYSDVIAKGTDSLTFTIPKDCIQNNLVALDFAFPDAVSPKELGIGNDVRELAFAVKEICITDAQHMLDVLYGDFNFRDYTFGTPLTFGHDGSIKDYTIEGLSFADQAAHCWTNDGESIFGFRLSEPADADLTVTMDIMTVYNTYGNQRIQIFANDHLCHEETLSDGKVLEFTIPKEAVTGDKLILKLVLPDAVCPAEKLGPGHDARILALALRGLTIADITG